MLLEVRQETEVHFLVGKVILGLLYIFKKRQASSRYEALNSVHLSRGQRDGRPPFQMTWRPTAFSGVSTGDSDMPSSCEMKDEPEFTPLQGNRACFSVRSFRGPFHYPGILPSMTVICSGFLREGPLKSSPILYTRLL